MENRVLALGFFDGVHLGHAALLSKTIQRAHELGAIPGVLSFTRHPSALVRGESVPLINTAQERCRLIRERFGISDVILWDFDDALMHLSPEAFLRRVRQELSAVHFVAGYDYRFGNRGAGDARLLTEYANAHRLGADILQPVIVQGAAVSSTRIRDMLLRGEVKSARELLGHPHCMIGRVEKGEQLGRQLDFPTANLHFSPEVLVPRHGVYLSRVHIRGEVFPGITNIGVRPTVSSAGIPGAETHILGFRRDIYGEEICLELLEFMRGEMRFASKAELQAQVLSDIERAKHLKAGDFGDIISL